MTSRASNSATDKPEVTMAPSFLARSRFPVTSRRRPAPRLRLEQLECRDQPAVLNVGASEPYTTIGTALGAAADGDTILIDDGTYAEHLGVGHAVTLAAVNPGQAIIDGGGSGTLAKSAIS